MARRFAKPAKVAGASLVFVSGALFGVWQSADLPPVRRFAAATANRVLADIFQGHIVARDIRKIDLGPRTRIRVAEVTVADPEGHRVLDLHDVDAEIDLATLLVSIARNAPNVAISEVKVADADVSLDREGNELAIARAFSTKTAAAAPSSAPPSKSAPPRVAIDSVRIGHAKIHGDVAEPPVDGDVDDLKARVYLANGALTMNLDGARILARSPVAPGQTAPISARASGQLDVVNGALIAHAALEGAAGDVHFVADAKIDHGVLDASLDVPETPPEATVRLFPSAPIASPVALHATAKGKLPSIAIHATARAGSGSVVVNGQIADGAFSIDAEPKAIDARAFGGPETRISAHVHAEGTLGDAPKGTFHLETSEVVVSGNAMPAVRATGTLDPARITAKFEATDPRANAKGDLVLDVPTKVASFDVTARASDLRAVAPTSSGSATAHAKGTIDLAQKTIKARFDADGSPVTQGITSVASVHAEGTASGPLAAPQIDVVAKATNVRLAAPGKEPLVYPSATARARVTIAPSPKITSAVVHVDAKDGPIDVTAEEIAIDHGAVAVRGAKVTGMGAPLEVDAHVAAGSTTIRAHGDGVDLPQLGKLTGIGELSALPDDARATFDVDLVSNAERADGHVDLRIASKSGIGAEIHAKLAGRHVSVKGNAAIGTLAAAEIVSAEIDLPGPPSAATILRATGAVEVRGVIDLAQGASLFAGDSVESLSGTLTFEARADRLDSSTLPAFRASAETRGLAATIDQDGKAVRYANVDAKVHAAYDAETDDTEAAVTLWDAHGVVASGDSKTRAPIKEWIRERPKPRVIAELVTSTLVDIPHRSIRHLPWIPPPVLAGGVSGRVEWLGSLAAPHLTLVARADALHEVNPPRGTPTYAPIDGAVEARWDGERIVVALHADERDDDATRAARKREHHDKKPGSVRGLILAHARPRELFRALRDPNAVPWNASAEVDVANLELAPMPLPIRTRGVLSGRTRLVDLDGTPTLETTAHVDGLTIQNVKIANGDLTLNVKDKNVAGTLKLAQSDGGWANLEIASSALDWKGVDVTWDPKAPSRVDYVVNAMRLAILKPLVRRAIPEIDGRVDGRGSATVTATSQTLEGNLVLSEGHLYVDALGEEVNDLKATATVDGNGNVRISDLNGKIGSGIVNASATAKLTGLAFDSANATIVIPTGKGGVPVSSEGAVFASATGEVDIAAQMAADRKSLAVTVTVPHADIALPNRGPQALQSLDADPTIAIGVRGQDGSLAPALLRPPSRRAATPAETTQPLAMRFTVALGEDTLIEGRGVRIYIRGKTVVDIAKELAVTGKLDLKENGTIETQGRRFLVDHGSVTFNPGDAPDNPWVTAAAYWNAADGTRVWVEFNAPLKTGKITLRSEPELSQGQILSVLLFGQPDPNAAASQSGATSVGAGIGASGLNEALGDLSQDLDVETNSTAENRMLTKVNYRLRQNLSVQLAYAGAGTLREPDTTFLALDWVFIPKWSLIGTRGDQGTTIVDLLFQHRY